MPPLPSAIFVLHDLWRRVAGIETKIGAGVGV